MRIKNFKSTVVLCMLATVLSSCSIFSSAFVPSTMESARCKRDCTSKYHSCNLYNCDASLLACMDYCMDIDRIANEKAKK